MEPKVTDFTEIVASIGQDGEYAVRVILDSGPNVVVGRWVSRGSRETRACDQSSYDRVSHQAKCLGKEVTNAEWVLLLWNDGSTFVKGDKLVTPERKIEKIAEALVGLAVEYMTTAELRIHAVLKDQEPTSEQMEQARSNTSVIIDSCEQQALEQVEPKKKRRADQVKRIMSYETV